MIGSFITGIFLPSDNSVTFSAMLKCSMSVTTQQSTRMQILLILSITGNQKKICDDTGYFSRHSN
jgi:hypothetical protein